MLKTNNFKLFCSVQTLMNAEPQVIYVNISVSMNQENSHASALKDTR